MGRINIKWTIIATVLMGLLISYFFFFDNTDSNMKESISMAGMVIEEKHHHIEPGEYLEMWVIGYNAYEKKENQKRYKIFIEEAMVYNLLE